jgi:hypothetical protein
LDSDWKRKREERGEIDYDGCCMPACRRRLKNSNEKIIERKQSILVQPRREKKYTR